MTAATELAMARLDVRLAREAHARQRSEWSAERLDLALCALIDAEARALAEEAADRALAA